MTCTRRAFLLGGAAAALCAAMPRSALGLGASSLFDIPLIEYQSPSWNPRPTAIRRLLLEVEMTTSIEITPNPTTVRLDDAAGLFTSPLVMLAGDRGFDPWSSDQRAALERYLSAGGMLVVDGSEGRAAGGFDASIRRELAAILPQHPLTRVPADHVMYKSFYLVEGAPGRTLVQDHLEGVTFDDRLAVVYSQNDMMGAWARDNFGNYQYDVHPGGERQRELAYRLGVNIAMYSMCLDYKEDQVHVPFILERRRWRVD